MFVSPLGTAAGAPFVSNVTLSGEIISSIGPGYTRAVLWIMADGTVWADYYSLGSIQVDVATDWIVPNEHADSSYEVRFTNLTTSGTMVVAGYDLFIPFADEGVWIDLSENRSMIAWTANALNPISVTFDLEIRKDGGAVLATGSYALNARRFDIGNPWY